MFFPKKILPAAFLVFMSSGAFAQGMAWDFLRPMTQFALDMEVPVKFVVLAFSAALLVLSWLALKKTGSKKFFFLTGAFGLFSLKILLTLADIFFSPGRFMSETTLSLFDLLILAALFLAVLKKQ